MKEDFYKILKQSKRQIVIHHCHLINNIVDLLEQNDLVFFDDCVYSQYVFLKDNIDKLISKNINCVLGFSTSLYRQLSNKPIYDITTAELHDRIHADDKTALDGFMSLDELQQLLKYDNVYLACHGNMHLQLQKCTESHLDCIQQFTADTNKAVELLNKYNLHTNIFVYPYAYDFMLSDVILKRFGFRYVFAGTYSQRQEIEKLI